MAIRSFCYTIAAIKEVTRKLLDLQKVALKLVSIKSLATQRLES